MRYEGGPEPVWITTLLMIAVLLLWVLADFVRVKKEQKRDGRHRRP